MPCTNDLESYKHLTRYYYGGKSFAGKPDNKLIRLHSAIISAVLINYSPLQRPLTLLRFCFASSTILNQGVQE